MFRSLTISINIQKYLVLSRMFISVSNKCKQGILGYAEREREHLGGVIGKEMRGRWEIEDENLWGRLGKIGKWEAGGRVKLLVGGGKQGNN